MLAGIAAASVQGRLAMGERAGAGCASRGRVGGAAGARAAGPRSVPRAEERLRPACGRRHPAAGSRAARTPVPVRAASADRAGATAPDAGRAGNPGPAAPVGGWDHYLVFEPLELLERLASLTPRPRINLLLYYGVLGARSAWRSRLAAIDGEHSWVRLEAPNVSSKVAGASHGVVCAVTTPMGPFDTRMKRTATARDKRRIGIRSGHDYMRAVAKEAHGVISQGARACLTLCGVGVINRFLPMS